MQIMIGSQAVKFTPSQIQGTIWEVFQSRINKSDWDYATDEDDFRFELRGSQRYEYHPMKELFEVPLKEYPINDVLYTIKLSHSIYDVNFTKTMWDIAFLEYLGAKSIPELQSSLAKKWTTIHTRHHRGFDFPHEELFEDNVPRLIPHNILHILVSQMVRGTPLPKWEELKSKKLLNNLENSSYEDRFWVNVEEAIVFTIERHYLRALHCGVQSAYIFALRDLITRCSPPDEALWMAQNYKAIRNIGVENFNLISNLIFSIYGKYTDSNNLAELGIQASIRGSRSSKILL